MNNILCFPSDKNGCGFYRTIVPLGYCSAVMENWNINLVFQFVFDLNLINTSNKIRFQRQCTDKQKRCIIEYRRCIDSIKSKCELVYELDDIVHGIEPHNIMAYQFYTKTRRQNVIDIMKMMNLVTFSTKFLKHFYEKEFNITNSVVVPNFVPKFLWNPDFSVDKKPYKSKPVILWAGSASHVGPGGDLEFLLPLIEKTVDEFEWLFVGCCPPKLDHLKNNGKISFMNWTNFYEYPRMMQSIKADLAIAPIRDSLFNYAKSDLKYLEYAAMNIPSICSSIGNGIGPYDQAKAYTVNNTIDDWYNAIKDLLGNEEKYYEVINKQHDYVSTRWLENPENIELYKKVYS
jgi:hypothetical protein